MPKREVDPPAATAARSIVVRAGRGSTQCTIRGACQEVTNERPPFANGSGAVPCLHSGATLVSPGPPRGVDGRRLGELVALRRQHIHLEARTVKVVASVVDVVGQQRSYGAPKSAAGKRTVAIPPHIIAGLRLHLDTYSQPGATDLVFVGDASAPLRRNNFTTRVWNPAMAALRRALPEGRFHFHDLRAFHLTSATQHGATVKELKHRAGHASPAVALRHQRAASERDQALAEVMSRPQARCRHGLDCPLLIGRLELPVCALIEHAFQAGPAGPIPVIRSTSLQVSNWAPAAHRGARRFRGRRVGGGQRHRRGSD